jgi:hypothetical protein
MPDKYKIGTNYEAISSVILCRLIHVLCFGSAIILHCGKFRVLIVALVASGSARGLPHPTLFPAGSSRSGCIATC